MFPDFLFLSNPPSQYEQVIYNFMKTNRFQIHAKENHRQQLMRFAIDQKYMDSPLSKSSIFKIGQIKNHLSKFPQFQTILVAPLRKSMQTCYEIFKNDLQKQFKSTNKTRHFVIEPLLADILNSTASIGILNQHDHSEEYNKYKQFYQNFNVIEKSEWIYDILSKYKKSQIQNNGKHSSSNKYMKLMKQKKSWKEENSLQSQSQFAQRLKQLKLKLFDYQKMGGNNKKVLIIASAEVLNALGSTDFHQNGQTVNPLRMNSGEINLVYLVIQGQKVLKQLDHQFNIPFCS